jgi:hypothetical protein
MASELKNDDCLLVGRDGVDYKVSYEDFVDGLDVDGAEYAKLDGDGQEITNTAKFQCQNEQSYHDNTTVKAPHAEFAGSLKASYLAGIDGDFVNSIGVGALTVDTYLTLNDSAINGASSVTAKEFIGDGSKLTNLPAGDVEFPLEHTDDDEWRQAYLNPVISLYNKDWPKDNWAEGGTFVDASGITIGSTSNHKPNYSSSSLGALSLRVIKHIGGYIEDEDSMLHLGGELADDKYFIKTDNGSNTKFSVNGSGSVTATEFIGDGSKLTNLPGGLPDFRTLTPLS